MCGIVGVVGNAPATPILTKALKRLEYRGYDSAGVAVIDGKVLDRRRAKGKIRNLEEVLEASPLVGTLGIAHTRWATHGVPSVVNAHPHAAPGVAVVHNGIIENYVELRNALQQKGYVFETETDTETVAVGLSDLLDQGKSPVDAVKELLPQLHGAYALAILFENHDNLLVGARKGSPLAIGVGEGERYLGSDALALAPFTNKIVYLEEGDWCVLQREGHKVYDSQNTLVERSVTVETLESQDVDRGNYAHYMLKEIHEQPSALARTLKAYTHPVHSTLSLPPSAEADIDFTNVSEIYFVSCGTAHYATRVAEYWFETYAKIPCRTDIASEFRYRQPVLRPDGLAIFVSQSGETADTLAALRYCKSQGVRTVGMVNVASSTIAREADTVLPTAAGPEIGVASTKAFTAQLTALAATCVIAARQRQTQSSSELEEMEKAVLSLPDLISGVLGMEESVKALANILEPATDAYFLGRGASYPIALEGALKLKEISYIHAEGFASGELKHGPIALITEDTPVVVVAPKDELFEKNLSNLQEVAARGGQVILLSFAEGVEDAGNAPKASLVIPETHGLIAPVLYTIPLQFLSYYAALLKGTDVDQPRNLAKSVTVE